jgi:membrane fusion protein, epimerase transport system
MNSQVAASTAVNEPVLETSDKKPRLFGLVVLLITFGIFGTWAAFAPLDSASNAPGVVSVKGKRKTVQHFEGGIVREILVSEGEVVQKDQPLIVLNDTQFSGELGVLLGQFYATKALESRLEAERDDLDEITFPDQLDVDDNRAVEAKQNQRQIFIARLNARLGEKEVLQQRIIQFQSQIEGLEALVRSQLEMAESFEQEITDLAALLEDGFVEKTRIIELQRSLSRTRGEIADQRASIAETKVRIGETKLEILQLNKRFKTEVVDELSKAQAQVFDLEERITVLEDKVKRTVVRAPVAGKVLGLSAHTIGGVVQGGVPLLDIVPESHDLIVDAKVPPADIDRVHPGMEANIRFSVFKRRTTPVFPGRVVKVAPDRQIDEETGAPYYAATIELTEEGKKMLENGDLELVAGMPAEVLIRTGERTLLQYLTQPAKDAMARSLIEE